MSNIVVYKCVVCGKDFDKRESLAAHLGHHRDVEFKRLSVRLPKERLDWFLNYCKRHNTTSCHLFLAFISMVEAGEKEGHVITVGSNPIVFQLHEHFSSKPRSHGKYNTTYMPSDIRSVETPCAYYHCGCGMPAVETLRLPSGFMALCSTHLEWEKKKRMRRLSGRLCS